MLVMDKIKVDNLKFKVKDQDLEILKLQMLKI